MSLVKNIRSFPLTNVETQTWSVVTGMEAFSTAKHISQQIWHILLEMSIWHNFEQICGLQKCWLMNETSADGAERNKQRNQATFLWDEWECKFKLPHNHILKAIIMYVWPFFIYLVSQTSVFVFSGLHWPESTVIHLQYDDNDVQYRISLIYQININQP